MLIEWQDSLLVGFRPIDLEHQALVGLINSLYDSAKARGPREALDDALFALADKVAEHFNHENRLMLNHNYPGRPRHLLEHRKLIDRFDTVLDHLDLLDADNLLDAVSFMDRWFLDHIITSDAQLAKYLRERSADESV